MSEPTMPDPFACARRIIGIGVLLQPQDVTEVWHSLTLDEAIQLLDTHRSLIAVQMLSAGISAAIELIKDEGAMS